MDASAPGTRDRIVEATGTLFRRQGYTGTGLKEIATESGAQIGSIYHFFGSKEALAAQVIRLSGAWYGTMVLGLLAHGPADPAESLDAAFQQAAVDLAEADYADACPIATVALEVASTNETLRTATAEVFVDWTDALAAWCGGFIDDPAGARDLATTVIGVLEGAFVLARAQRSPEPLLAAGRSLKLLVEAMRR